MRCRWCGRLAALQNPSQKLTRLKWEKYPLESREIYGSLLGCLGAALAQQVRNKVAQSKQLASWDTRTPLDVFSPFPVDSGPRLVVRVSSSDSFTPAKTRLHVTVAAVGRVQWPACLGRKRLRRSVVTGVVLSLPHVAILKRLQRTSASRRAAHGRALHGPGAAVILRAFSPAVCTGSARLGFEAGRRVGSATAGQLRQRDQG